MLCHIKRARPSAFCRPISNTEVPFTTRRTNGPLASELSVLNFGVPLAVPVYMSVVYCRPALAKPVARNPNSKTSQSTSVDSQLRAGI